MERQELIEHARKQIDELKAMGVPKLMEEGKKGALEKILETFDYSTYEDQRRPEFTIGELKLSGKEDLLATAFYVWGNPYVDDGDLYFFEFPYHFGDMLFYENSRCTRNLWKIAYDEDFYGLFINRSNMTIEALLGIQEASEGQQN